MKVYIVMAFEAEPYGKESWVHAVYDSLEKAKASVGERYVVYDEDVCEETGNRYGGYMLSDRVEEHEVQ